MSVSIFKILRLQSFSSDAVAIAQDNFLNTRKELVRNGTAVGFRKTLFRILVPGITTDETKQRLKLLDYLLNCKAERNSYLRDIVRVELILYSCKSIQLSAQQTGNDKLMSNASVQPFDIGLPYISSSFGNCILRCLCRMPHPSSQSTHLDELQTGA